MFVVLEKGSKNKVIGQFKTKKKAIEMMKKTAGSKVIQIGKFATVDDKPVDIKVGDELSYTRVKLSKKIKEEVELDEDGHADVASAIRQCKTVMEDAQQIMAKLQTMSPEDSLPTWWTNKFAVASNSMNKMRDYIVNPLGEALDKKDEPTVKRIVGKLKKASQAHAGQAKDLEKAMDEDAVETAKDKIAKEKETDKKKHDKMMDRARIQQARQKNMETEEVDMKTVSSMMEQSARADARRAMRRDPEMKQKGFSKDMSATDDDKKAASKNIMVQMRKAQSLRGKFEVEFADGKKVRIPEKVAVAVQQKFNAMRKPADKEKFQAKVAKSYKDMLRALKEESDATPDYKAGGKAKAAEYTAKAKQMVGAEGFASDAQRRAAFAQGYKAKGKKNKKESVLDRIDSKLKEIKNG